MKLFDKEEINTGRQFEMDMAKAVCLFGLVIIHCFNIFVSFYETQNNFQFILLYVVNFIFGAPTFMFCMGVLFFAVCLTVSQLYEKAKTKRRADKMRKAAVKG